MEQEGSAHAAIAYHAIRALILRNALEQELGRISFKAAVDLLRQWLPQAAGCHTHPPQAGVLAQGMARAHHQRAQPAEAWTTGAQSPETTTQNLSTAHLTSTPVPRTPPSRPLPLNRVPCIPGIFFVAWKGKEAMTWLPARYRIKATFEGARQRDIRLSVFYVR